MSLRRGERQAAYHGKMLGKKSIQGLAMVRDEFGELTRSELTRFDCIMCLSRPHIMWLSTVQQDMKQHHLMLPEAADSAQNRPLWKMMSTYGATQS